MHIHIITRLLMFIFYVMVTLGKAYYGLGEVTLNYESTYKYLIARDIILLIILLVILLFIFYEIYHNCTRLNYRFKLVREEN